MAVTSDHIWYPAGGDSPAYDLRRIVSWHVRDSKAFLRFQGDSQAVVEVDQAAFETAKQASLDAGG